MDGFIRTYGVEAVMNRSLFAGELFRMNAARKVYHAFISRKASANWAEWSERNKDEAELLTMVERIKND